MSWLCIFSLSCLTNPTASMNLPPTAPPETVEVAAYARPALVSEPSASAPLRCELRQEMRDGRHVLVALVRARAEAKGDYTFSLDATDADGNQVTSSTGTRFGIRAGEERTLVGPSVGLGRGSRINASLKLEDDRERTLAICHL